MARLRCGAGDVTTYVCGWLGQFRRRKSGCRTVGCVPWVVQVVLYCLMVNDSMNVIRIIV